MVVATPGRSAVVTTLAVGLAFALGWLVGGMSAVNGRRRKRRQEDDGGGTVIDDDDDGLPAPRRFGGAIKLKPDRYRRYRELHDHVWDGVLQRMRDSNVRNFTIYYHDETNTLFSHFEWIGHWQHCDASTGECPLTADEEKKLFGDDMRKIAQDPVTRLWWAECEPCQDPFSQWRANSLPLSEGGSGDWWAPLECVNHCGHWPTSYSLRSRDPDFVKLDNYGDDAVE
jgi:L-rhamnose mutarotase